MVEYFQKIFSASHQRQDLEATRHLENKVTNEDNEMFIASPTMQEVKEVVFAIDPDSAPRPDRYSNQAGFIKGRSISENILLAQELINDIKKPNRGGNVVIKLDMAKAYNRVSWTYLCMVLRKMGFCEIWIDLIFRYIYLITSILSL